MIELTIKLITLCNKNNKRYEYNLLDCMNQRHMSGELKVQVP